MATVEEENKEEIKYCFFLKDSPSLINLAVHNTASIKYTGISALSRHMHDITETKITVMFDDLALQFVDSEQKFLFKSFHLNATRTGESKNIVVEKIQYSYYTGTQNVYTSCEEWVNGEIDVPFFDLTPDHILNNYKDLVYFPGMKRVYDTNADRMKLDDATGAINAVKKNKAESLKTSSKLQSELREKIQPNYIFDDAYKHLLNKLRSDFKRWNQIDQLPLLYNNTDPITVIATMIFSVYHDVVNKAKIQMMVHGTLNYSDSKQNELIVGEVPETTTITVMFPGFLTKYYESVNLFDNCEFTFVDDGRITYTSGQSFADVYVNFKNGNIAIKICVPNVYQEKTTNQWDLWSSLLLYKLFFYGEIEEEFTYAKVASMARDRLFWIKQIDLSMYSCSVSQCVRDACLLKKEDMLKFSRDNEPTPLMRKYAAYVLMLNYNLELNKHANLFSTPDQTMKIIKTNILDKSQSVLDFLKTLNVPSAFKIRDKDDFFETSNLQCIYGTGLEIPKTVPAILSLMKLYWLHRGYGISCGDVVDAMQPGNKTEDIISTLRGVSRQYAIQKNTTPSVTQRTQNLSFQPAHKEIDKIYNEYIKSVKINFDVLFAYPKEKYGKHTQFVLDMYHHFQLNIVAADVNHLFNHLYVSTPKETNSTVVHGIRNFVFDNIRLKTNTTFMSRFCAKILAARKTEFLDNLRGQNIMTLTTDNTKKVELDENSLYFYIFWYAYWDSVNIKKVKPENLEITLPEQLKDKYFTFSGKTKTIHIGKNEINSETKLPEIQENITGKKVVTIDSWNGTAYSFSHHTLVKAEDEISFTVKWKYDPRDPSYYPIFTGPIRVYAEQMDIDFRITERNATVEIGGDGELQLTLLPTVKQKGGGPRGLSNLTASVVGGVVIVLCAFLPR